jgi:exonuclease SbcC
VRAESDFDRLAEALSAVERRLAEARAEAGSARARAAELSRTLLAVGPDGRVDAGEVAPLPDVAALEEEAQSLAARAEAARHVAGLEPTLAARRASRAQVLDERRRAVADADAAARQAAEDARVGAARHEDLRVALAREVPEGTVAQRRAELRARRERAQRVVREVEQAEAGAQAQERTARELVVVARAELAEAEREAADATAELAGRAGAAGFTDAGAAQAALAAAPDLAADRRTVAAHHAGRAAAQARLAALAAELDGQPAPDVPALAAAAERAEAAAAALAVELGEAQAGLAELERAHRLAGELVAERAELERRLATFGRLARVVTGENRLRMSLPRYVLASRMDEIAEAASQRLLAMSRGRYQLLRTDAVRHAGRGSGLELLVADRATGQERSVASLSGGEMFLASLSLAMALADTVQAHAGGVRLESLFIDEGFGSLDDETLDQVMRTLEDLRAGGRLVGLISHVPELRERLTTRLTVHKGARGSTTRLVL